MTRSKKMKKVKLGPQTLLYPTPAVLVGALVGGRPNYMTAAWCSIAASKPPAISVALQPVRYTLKGIKEQGVFSINVPSAGMVKEVDYCGIYSGNKKDKSTIFKTFYGVLEKAPLIEECPVNLECKAIHFLQVGSHILIIGEIVEAHISEHCTKAGKADPQKIDPLIYAIGSMQYHRLGEPVAQAFRAGREG
jgi:flavin reductase (DIM6/NTAB) family NADH-FMN oxidoreductase RutF